MELKGGVGVNRDERTNRMEKYIFINKIFTGVQIVLLALSVVLNFTCDDAAVFITTFTHVGMFVLYNIIVENIIEYGFLRKRYAKIYDETSPLSYFKLKKRTYTEAKNKSDFVTTKLILQSFIKSSIMVLNIVLLLFMVSFE